MPRITAPTLAEHQDLRRAALVDAAVALLATEGVAALTPGAAGRRAGLARSSVYQYFASGAALLAAAIEEVLGRLAASVTHAVAVAPDRPVDAWVTAVLDAAATDDGRALAALERAELPGPCRDRLDELHRGVVAPLATALGAAGVDDPEALAGLVAGAVGAAARQVAAGVPPEVARARVLGLLHHGIDAPADA